MDDETYTLWHINQHDGTRLGVIARGYTDADNAINEADRLTDLMFTDIAVYQGDQLIVAFSPTSLDD